MGKSNKKVNKITSILFLIFFILIIGFFIYDALQKRNNLGNDLSNSSDTIIDSSNDSSVLDPELDGNFNDLTIYIPELGNNYSGDCTLIKSGNTEILIDAGSLQSSAKTLVPFIQQYCTDGILEYVIATHAHKDHISAFVGLKNYPGIFESFECKTIIDFPKTNSNSQIYKSYVEKRDAEVALGAIHYTALDCWKGINGASPSYEISNGINLDILYTEFYEKETNNENNYSVCLMISQNDNHFLFTGDLEKEGEVSLIKNNKLPKCKFFKAGHHGSETANSKELLAIIQPEIVCVQCCCGSEQYTDDINKIFPSQAFIDNVSIYTDKIYIPTIATLEKPYYEMLNGNIQIVSSKDGIKTICSKSDMVLKETEWFKKYRTLPEGAV